jgi:hypothetical protein
VNGEVTRLNILVEGQTEEAFIRDVVAPHLNSRSVFVNCRRVETSRRKEKPTGQTIVFRGGIVNYGKLRNDVLKWLKEDSEAFVTTMIDLYALPPDFPGLGEARARIDPHDRIAALEQFFREDIAYRKFIPYLQLHEYEALLFSDVAVIDAALSLYNGRSRVAELQQIRDQFVTPEHINEGITTAPSKQLQRIFPGYDKLFFGPLIAATIGLPKLRGQCPHFAQWVARLESLPLIREIRI